MTKENTKCYLCEGEELQRRKGKVRDNPDLAVLECAHCGLVMLSSFSHIADHHYEDGNMHDGTPKSIDEWLIDSKEDDLRRLELVKGSIEKKILLDFGCGNGGFLNYAKAYASVCEGIELHRGVAPYWDGKIEIYNDLSRVLRKRYDVLTAFHVIEHLPDPRSLLCELKLLMGPESTLVIEVPNANDALVTLYDCLPFQEFTYWSNHLFLFTESTLRELASQAGLSIISIEQTQRYPISNHLHWLSTGRPGGHAVWSFLDSDRMRVEYETILGKLGVCDTIIAWLRLP